MAGLILPPGLEKLGGVINTGEAVLLDMPKMAASCLICGDTVELTREEVNAIQHGVLIGCKICEKCKHAVMQMRANLEAENSSEEETE